MLSTDKWIPTPIYPSIIIIIEPLLQNLDTLPQPRSGLILKSGTGTGTQIQNLRDLGLEPGLKFEKTGIGHRDRDSDLRDEGFRDSTLGDCPGD